MISVFDIGNTNYTGNGNVVLQPKECKLRNIAGGNYDLTMSHPIDPEGKWKHLVPGAIIKAPVPREEIENAFAGYDADVYKTTTEAALREGPSEPSTITYPAWSQYNTYSVGSKVTSGGKNYQCTYFDQNSTMRAQSPGASSWWKEIPRTTSGAAALVTLATGTDLYFVEDYDSTWYKMSTYYGIVGYIKKTQVTYDRHLTPSETQPRIITEQLFRIEKVTADTKNRTVTVNAKHVSYDLAGILVKDVSIAQATPAMALGRIAEGLMMDYDGTIATDMQTDEDGTYTGDIKGKNGIFALLDPDKGIVSTFNAAYKRDNWDLFVLKKTEVDRGYRLKYRKNMLGVNWAQDNTGLVTRVVPVAKDEAGADLYLPEMWVDSPLINNYPKPKMEQLTVKGQVGKDKGTGDGSTWTESDLLAEMRTKAGERFSVDKADRVVVTVTVDFEQRGDTEEYPELKGLETVLLYDTVSVENEEISLDIQLYVSEWEWDAIRQKITALKLVNTTDYQKGNVTGYNVQSKSIGSDKLSDDVAGDILEQVVDIIPEYADPNAARPISSVSIVDNLTSTDTDKALSAKQGKVLNDKISTEYESTELTSLDGIKDFLTTVNGTLSDNQWKEVRFNIGGTFIAPFGSWTSYSGRLTRFSSNEFVCEVMNTFGQEIQICNNSGTWNIVSLNDNIIQYNLGTFGDLSALCSALTTYAASILAYEIQAVRFNTNVATNYWEQWDLHVGILQKVDSNNWSAIFTSSSGQTLSLGTFNAGTSYDHFASKELNSNINSIISSQSASSASTLANLKSSLLSIAETMKHKQRKTVNFTAGFAEQGFVNGATYEGDLIVVSKGTSYMYFACFFHGVGSNSIYPVYVMYNNGSWKFNNVNSKIIYDDQTATTNAQGLFKIASKANYYPIAGFPTSYGFSVTGCHRAGPNDYYFLTDAISQSVAIRVLYIHT